MPYRYALAACYGTANAYANKLDQLIYATIARRCIKMMTLNLFNVMKMTTVLPLKRTLSITSPALSSKG